jgi:uncharacterized protein
MSAPLLFSHKGARYRILSADPERVISAIIRCRAIIERYIESHPVFAEALQPIPTDPEAPAIVRRMILAGAGAGVGPMAAVAGAMAQAALEKDPCLETQKKAPPPQQEVVENGGDIFIQSTPGLTVGIYGGPDSPLRGVAFKIGPEQTPLALCSSSAGMGHSRSFGRCDLATVAAREAAIADAAATRACNLVQRESDIPAVLEEVLTYEGVMGLLLVKNKKVGLIGEMPELLRHQDPGLKMKVSRDEGTPFPG